MIKLLSEMMLIDPSKRPNINNLFQNSTFTSYLLSVKKYYLFLFDQNNTQ